MLEVQDHLQGPTYTSHKILRDQTDFTWLFFWMRFNVFSAMILNNGFGLLIFVRENQKSTVILFKCVIPQNVTEF